jgi:hypothetical protein
MSGKGVLAFVGKSIAFSLISGLIWGLILVFIASFSTRSSSSDQGARIAQQMESYARQSNESQAQLARNAELQERSAKLLDTQERLFAEQAKLQQRFAAILDKWEKIPSR